MFWNIQSKLYIYTLNSVARIENCKQKSFNSIHFSETENHIKLPKFIPEMSSKRKSQPTRIRDQENELSPAQSPDMATEKGM